MAIRENTNPHFSLFIKRNIATPFFLPAKLDDSPLLHRICTDFAPTLVRRKNGLITDLLRICMGIKEHVLNLIFFTALKSFLLQYVIKFAKSVHNTEKFCNFVFGFRFINYKI